MSESVENVSLERIDYAILTILESEGGPIRRKRLDERLEDLYKGNGEGPPAKDTTTKHLRYLEEKLKILKSEGREDDYAHGPVIYTLLKNVGQEVFDQIKRYTFSSADGIVVTMRRQINLMPRPASDFRNKPGASRELLSPSETMKEITPTIVIKTMDEFLKYSKYKFDEYPNPLVSRRTGKVDLVVVSSHSEYEADKAGATEALANLGARGGNHSDSEFIPLLGYTLAALSRNSNYTPSPDRIPIRSRLDIHVDKATLAPHNVLTLGGDNVNLVARKVLHDTWDGLPIRFARFGDHETIVSRLSGREWHAPARCGILIMVPNIYTTDVDKKGRPNKVIIICAGIEIWGTQAGVRALCDRKDRRGKPLQNNDHDGRYPAKVVEAQINEEPIENLAGIDCKIWDLTSFEFRE